MANNIANLIGNTPMMRLSNVEAKYGLNFKLFAKLEMYNPTGSAKDRVAKSIILDAERTGRLKAGGTIVEPTSGNTGIGLACLAASRGYKAIIYMPDSMSEERVILLKKYGAEVVLTPGRLGMAGAIQMAEEYVATHDNTILAGQFTNPANVAAHEATTGPEIYDQTGRAIDYLVATIGTGGTITGSSKYLKSQNPKIQVIGVEPKSSPLLTEGWAGPHGIQGIGANFIPPILDLSLIDQVLTVTEQDAYKYSQELCHLEGVFAGISSGAALSAALSLNGDPALQDATVVVVLPDSGDRYLSCCPLG